MRIFCIGFNKCGTAAIDYFLRNQGINSIHWQRGDANLAVEIEARASDPEAMRAFLSQWTACSDLTYCSETRVIEANRHFRRFHALFPDAWFILNDRDPDAWVKSRLRHRDGSFAQRAAAFHNCRTRDLPARWKAMREAHIAAVLDHFAMDGRFLHFRIDRDDPARLVEFLAPEFALDVRYWRRINTSFENMRIVQLTHRVKRRLRLSA
jgi:hypothetical protein